MPKGAKESEDEAEMKIGRRTRATGSGALSVDSPLRRSTRIRQPLYQDDESSPESMASDATGPPPTRTTRRRTVVAEYSSSDNTRSLRSRKNSTASDTTDFADGEAPGDVKKRITRRSAAAIPSVETPTKTRLRPTTRAGSESKTMSPVRNTRRTRASSVDLEENNEIPRDKLLLVRLGTPVKTRNRASVLPSEPCVVEETEILSKEELSNDSHDVENINISNTMKSPVLRLQLDHSQSYEQMEVDETLGEESITDTVKLCDNVFESPLNNSSTSTSESKTNLELKEKLLSEIGSKSAMDLPKIVLHKTDIPIQKSPGNKENEKSNIVFDKKLKNLQSNNLTQRKSMGFINAKKNQIVDRLNKSTDERFLSSIDVQSVSVLPSSTNNSTSKSSETSMNVKSLSNAATVSMTIGSKNESITFLGENIDDESYKEFENNDNEETILIETKLRRNSLKSPSQESMKNNSIIEVDTTVDNLVNEDLANSIHDSSKVFDSSLIRKNKAESDSDTDSIPQHIVESNDPISSPVNRKSMEKKIQIVKFPTETLTASESELFNKTTSNDYVDTAEIQSDSIVEDIREEEINKEPIKDNKHRLSLNKRESISRKSPTPTPTSPTKLETDDENNDVNNMNEVETDIENLFQDIPAEEWTNNHMQSTIDKPNNTNDTCGVIEGQDVLTDKRSRQIIQKNQELKSRETSDYDSDETIIMQSTNTQGKCLETETPSIIAEEVMDIDNNATETEHNNTSTIAQPCKKSSKNRRSSTIYQDANNDKNSNKNKSPHGDDPSVSEDKSHVKDDSISQKTHTTSLTDTGRNSTDSKFVKSTSRKSLNIKSSESNKDNKLKRRTIAKMDSTKNNESPKKPIPTEDNTMDIDQNKNDNQEEIRFSITSPTNRKRQSLKSPIQNLIDDDTDEDDAHPAHNPLNQSEKSGETSKLSKNNSIMANTNSDSDSEEYNSDNNNQNSQTKTVPEFLLNASTSGDSSNDESASIDSDVNREMNLNGDSISKYSDDDIPGDECRASETETSDDADDDDDMANFIVDDDEDVEEEESDEENESEDEGSKMELSAETEEIQENELNESVDENEMHLKINSNPLLSSNNEEEENKNTSMKMKVTNVSRKSLSKKVANEVPINNSSTPKIVKRLSNSIVTTSDTALDRTLANVSLNDSRNKEESIHKSLEVLNTPTKEMNNIRQLKSSSTKKDSEKIQMDIDNSKKPRSKSLTETVLHQSMQIVPTESPEMKLLMKEKLNESLPTLKLKRRSSKVSRRSSLMEVKEDEHNEELPEECSIEHVQVTDEKEKKKKKKKKKLPADQTAVKSKIEKLSTSSDMEGQQIGEKKKKKLSVDQEMVTEELNASSTMKNQQIGKKNKKKKNLSSSENETLISEQVTHSKKKNNQKQVTEIVDKIVIDTKKLKKNKSKDILNSEPDLLSIVEDKAISIKKKTKKKISKSEPINFEEKKLPKPATGKNNSNIKRLPEDVLENLSDVPTRPKKRRKLDQKVLPSRVMFDSNHLLPDNLSIDDVGYIPVSASGGTSQFSVVNLKKVATKRSTKKSSTAWTFRERMLGRNMRQPVSAYVMYQQKLKASGLDKH